MNATKKKSAVNWLMEWTSPHMNGYISSVVLALLGVVCSIVPYFAISKIVVTLLSGGKDLGQYIRWIVICAVFWIVRYVLHSISTMFSHKATFSVISEVRRRLTGKLAILPMGSILSTPSGALKNIILERVDSIETVLVHIVPEMTTNLMAPLAIVIYLFTIDWRMALISLITLPLGLITYMGMMVGYEAKFANYVTTNKHLNATFVEYINGIEVIKAFNQSASSYDKFSSAAACNACDSASLWRLVLHGRKPFHGAFYPDHHTVTGHYAPIITAFSNADDLGKVSTVVGDITAVLDQPDLERPEQRVQLSNYEIKRTNVGFGYNDTQVLHDVNLQITPGIVTALVGPSGSEKQRISIARAILKDAPIIILDEATANVDPENEKLLQVAIHELTKNKTIIMIAHRLKTVRDANQILVVDGSKIVQRGTHTELMK